ncbi:MAG: glycosyltransferase family 39 protein [Bacteroidales bacterium]|nr:glycosyltransferase family 39 protein [Bacteroidales bacterium]
MKRIQKEYLFFLLGWLIINIIQSFYTQLHTDEAYYWVFSENLNWGYFDHPPMVAVLIKLGHLIFKNELGVRLFHILLSTSTLAIIISFIDDKKNRYFIMLFISSFLLIHTHIAGFFALPDTPLLFFTSLFFLVYKDYLNNDSIRNILLLGIIIAAMIYSKYHAILIVGFTILSHHKLLTKKSFWMIAIIVIILLIPHVYWQYRNDFPSLSFHIFGRSNDFMKLMNFPNYIFSQLFIPGILTGPIVIYLAIAHKPENSFEKTLRYNLIGFYIFFFFMCFKDWVEAHWLAAAFIPLIILSYKEIIIRHRLKKWFFWLALPSLLLIITARIVLISDTIGNKFAFTKSYHNWKKAANEISDVAAGRTVVVENSYQVASMYSFYGAKQVVPTLRSAGYRYSQFDLYKTGVNYIGKDVLLVSSYLKNEECFKSESIKGLKYKRINNYMTFEHISIEVDKEIYGQADDSVFISIMLTNNYSDTLYFNENLHMLPELGYRIYSRRDQFTKYFSIEGFSDLIFAPGEKKNFRLSFVLPHEKGNYKGYCFILFSGRYRGQASNKFKIRVTE